MLRRLAPSALLLLLSWLPHFVVAETAAMAPFLALAPMVFASTTWYVNGTIGSDNNNCLSSTTACKTIGHAISLASSGDSISVAAATYTETLTISMSLKIIGASASTTIIDGGHLATVVTISSVSAHVTLAKFIIKNGTAPFGGDINNSGSLTISNSTIGGNGATCNNSCSASGGGIGNSGSLTISNSTISGNTAASPSGVASGGGVYNTGTLTISNSTISANNAGGAQAEGGGIYTLYSGSTTLQDTIVANSSVGNCYGA